ncbi:MAG: hypothetical protein ACXVHV_06205, partial [Methanobacterium sp.]
MKIKKILPILILILGVILISGCTNNPTNQTASSGYFENQFVKFELPAGVTAKDTSNDTSFDIILYKNGNSIGEIDNEVNPQQAIDAIDGNNTTFA